MTNQKNTPEPTGKPFYYDFHTHLPPTGALRANAVLSFSLYEKSKIPQHALFTVGMHPWDSNRLDATRLIEKDLPALLASPRCLALGECGLDRLRGANMDTQLEQLEHQLRLAKEIKRSVVIHCVRAWGELQGLIRRVGFLWPKAIHGFRGNASVLKQLNSSDWYISVGLDNNGRLPEATNEIPRNRLLLETDISTVAIQRVYEAIAALKNVTVEDVQTQIRANMLAFFNKSALELSPSEPSPYAE